MRQELDDLNESLDNYEFIGEITSLNGEIPIDRTKYKRIYIMLLNGDIGIVATHEIPNIINGSYSQGRYLGHYYESTNYNVYLGALLSETSIKLDKLSATGYTKTSYCRVYAK